MRKQDEKDAALVKLDECKNKYPEFTKQKESNHDTYEDCKRLVRGEKTILEIRRDADNKVIGHNHLAWCEDTQRWLDGEIELDEFFGEAVIIGKAEN